MRRCLLAAAAAVVHAAATADDIRPVADPAAVVRHGNMRISVLRDAVLRLEYSTSGQFDDQPSLFALNRRFDTVPEFTSAVDGETVTVRTKTVEFSYTKGGDADRPSSTNTRAKLLVHPFTEWTPASQPDGNLHGTIRTLDRVSDPVSLKCPFAHKNFFVYYSHCEEGVVSRDGWVVVDDTLRPRMAKKTAPLGGDGEASDASAELWWPISPNPASLTADGSYFDLYLLTHGHDYKGALSDFVALSGRIPLMPRYSLGPAFSRWFQYSDAENTAIVQEGFAENGIPLDTLVVDMDWHYTYPRGVPNHPNPANVRVEGWTGHTVYPYLFPEPAHFISYLKRRGVAVTFNHHPAGGVEFHEATYPTFARALGKDPLSGQTLDFDVANAEYMMPYFQHVIKPIDDTGMQYWWLDFQQQPFTSVPLLNPTIACNHAWYTNPWRYGLGADAKKAKDRPYVMGRFGGLGAHRYPVGFVGDTYVRWPVLRYETYFMPTASNVGFQWSHDLGGFEGPSPAEFFTRHLQFGTFSPTLRTHSSKRSAARSIWTYAQPFFTVMRRFYRLRARLVPYIATMQRVAHDTGVQVVRPAYYEWPECSKAYGDQGLHQFHFGDDMWLAPIAAAAPSVQQGGFNVSGAGVTPWTFWLPPGTWIEWFSFQALHSTPSTAELEATGRGAAHECSDERGGGVYITRNYSMFEMPLFSRPGAIIPMRSLQQRRRAGGESVTDSSVLGLASQIPDALTFTVFAGVTVPAGRQSVTTTARVYDDDGATTAYLGGHYAWTQVGCEWTQTPGAAASHVAADGSVQLDPNSGRSSVVCTVHPTQLHDAAKPVADMPATRTYTWRFTPAYPPQSVTFNGVPVARDQFGAPDSQGENAAWADPTGMAWGYDAASLSLWVHVGTPQSVEAASSLQISYPQGIQLNDPALLTLGLPRILARAASCKAEIDKLYGALYPSDIEPLLNISAAASRINAAGDALLARELITAIPGYLQAARREIESWRIPAGHPAAVGQQRCLAVLRDAAAIPTPLAADDPAAIAASAEPTFKYEVGEHLQAPEPPLHEVYGDTELHVVAPPPGGGPS